MSKGCSWPRSQRLAGLIDLHTLSPVAAINGARIRELTGDQSIPDSTQLILRGAFRAVVGGRTFNVGFCLGDASGFSAIGLAVVDRLLMEAPGSPLCVVRVVHNEIAWDIVLRHLRSFAGRILLFTFPNSDAYDAGTAEVFFSKDIRQFDHAGTQIPQLKLAQRQQIRRQMAEILKRPPPPLFYGFSGAQEDAPWIFRIVTPAGKEIRAAVWDGRRDYAHEMPEDIVQWVGGERIAIVQVDSPVGMNRRSSLDLTHRLSKAFDGVIHWARNTETFESILKSFIRLDLETVGPPEVPDGWRPEITIFPAAG